MKIENILGYWQLDKSHQLFNGYFIMQEDIWFEGFMRFGTTDQQNSVGFVFGFYEPNKGFELFFCFDDSSYIYRVHCGIKDNVYAGSLSFVEPFTKKEIFKGNCSLVIKETNLSMENKIFTKMGISKSFMNNHSKEFYSQILSQKEKISKAIKNHENIFQELNLSDFLKLCNSQNDNNKPKIKQKYDYRNFDIVLKKI